MNNPYHIFDPSFFDEVIAMFGTTYRWFIPTGLTIDDMGRTHYEYEEQEIFGSLQPHTSSRNFSTNGNTTNLQFTFYCKSIYRIDFGHFIYFDKKFLYCDSVSNYDLGGVREVSLTMVNLNSHQDFLEWLKVKNGDLLV